MLVSMDKEHLPMAEWGFTQFDMPKKADIVDIGCSVLRGWHEKVT